ncbi:hypothetical protein G6L89_023085 (plasmid) [Agrobacterium fabrum]|uniref:hypothetical protein n=1 Tax=Agrobacterium fabrum TaxID=1176649 RepID=UPI0015725015|nr:hypothetical protein [Agrobacterium fabrum]NTB10826.1 hypothetical protein [Agrobacterium fabrum]
MKARYIVDTNVLIAASASDAAQGRKIDATPADPALRLKVWEWLFEFERSDTKIVLDGAGKILEEYERNLGFNDYGIQVVMTKFSTAAADVVAVEYDADGAAVLPGTLSPTIHDLSDRKMVSAALCSHADFGEGCVAFAGDTDWHEWETTLAAHNVALEPIIEEWSRQKYAEKKER